MADKEEEHEQEKPLTQKELKEMREMLENDRRWKWLARSMRNIAGWIVGVGVGITFGYDWLVKLLKWGSTQ